MANKSNESLKKGYRYIWQKYSFCAPENPKAWLEQQKRRLKHNFVAAVLKDLQSQFVGGESELSIAELFFLRKQLGPSYLNLLQFFLNHRCFMRSEVPERKDKSPTQLMTGQPHPHWLELLGFKRFQRA